ncbi:MAG: hypothetical protein KBS74_04100 [Clostridiales bacterium]|nr:hypothetical protein [Candidatus Cacconaster stercorequi]
MLKVGDRVRRVPATHDGGTGSKEMSGISGKKLTGTVVYIPEHKRFHVAEFRFGRYAYRECFDGVER